MQFTRLISGLLLGIRISISMVTKPNLNERANRRYRNNDSCDFYTIIDFIFCRLAHVVMDGSIQQAISQLKTQETAKLP